MEFPAIRRKSLLYRTGVEYAEWALNPFLGCPHGCQYPCYAYLIARRFKKINSMDDWTKPRIVENAPKLLAKELDRLTARGKLPRRVFMCFSTDPFPWDAERGRPSDLGAVSLILARRLNEAGVPVTFLTKGVYPVSALLELPLAKDNEYGITLVGDESFRKKFEPGAAPIQKRVEALAELANLGLKTWISIEPYPTPEIDPKAEDPVRILKMVPFIKKVVFGPWNYNRRTKGKEAETFYRSVVSRLRWLCNHIGIKLLVKS